MLDIVSLSPPSLSYCAVEASLKHMELKPEVNVTLKSNLNYCHMQLNQNGIIPTEGMVSSNVDLSPFVYLQLVDQSRMVKEQVDLLDVMVVKFLEDGVFL